MDDKFNALLNDPEKMKAAFEMASKIVGQTGTPAPSLNTDELAGTLKKMKDSGALDNLLSNLSASSSSAPSEESRSAAPSDEAQSKSSLSAMLPNLLQMMGGGTAVNSDKANLLKAIKPYVNEGRAGNIDRAVNVANMAKNAKSMLGGLKKP